MTQRFKSSINGGISLCRATNLAGAVMAMKPYLDKGQTTYLRETSSTCVVTFQGFPPEISATNIVGDPIPLPDWAEKAKQTLSY